MLLSLKGRESSWYTSAPIVELFRLFSSTTYLKVYLTAFIACGRNSHRLNPLHRLFHRTKKTVICPLCKALFAEKIELVIHIRERHWIGSKTLESHCITDYNDDTFCWIMTTEISPIKDFLQSINDQTMRDIMKYFQFEDYDAFVRYVRKLRISRKQW